MMKSDSNYTNFITNYQEMNEIKIYQELTYIQTFDWELYTTTVSVDDLNKSLNNNKFIRVWNNLINVSNIKKIFIKQLDEVDNALLQISDKNLRMRVQSEVDKRRKDWFRVNMDVYQNILNRLKD